MQVDKDDEDMMAAQVQEIERASREARSAARSKGGNGKDGAESPMPSFDWAVWEGRAETTQQRQAPTPAVNHSEDSEDWDGRTETAYQTVGPDAGPSPPAPAPQPRDVPQEEPTEPTPDTSKLSPTELWLASAAAAGRPGYYRKVNLIVDGGIAAAFERRRRGLYALFDVCYRIANMRDGTVKAKTATLCKLTGIGDPRTLNEWMNILCRRFRITAATRKAEKKPAGTVLPGPLERIRGTGWYRFKPKAVEAWTRWAAGNVAEQERRWKEARQRMSDGGKRGMTRRWHGHKVDRPCNLETLSKPLKRKGPDKVSRDLRKCG